MHHPRTRFLRALVLILASPLAACQDTTSPPVQTSTPDEPAAYERLDPGLRAGDSIPGHYIVGFKSAVADPRSLTGQMVRQQRGTLRHAYSAALKGFAARLSPQAVAALRANPNVAYVEPDRVVMLQAVQGSPPWGLDRIDQPGLPLNARYTYASTGKDVHVYVIDSGIRPFHQEFGTRVRLDFSAIDDEAGLTDCHGHGTHVAGIVGGATYGVAKAAILHSVRVAPCSGTTSAGDVISGVDWVTANHVKPAVANVSLGLPFTYLPLNTAIRVAIEAGVTFTIAAGNAAFDACGYSPANVQATGAITVGATNSSDQRASFSNTGSCVDLFAPGQDIVSAWHTGNAATSTQSGTSMAAPHVAGVAALILQFNPGATPDAIRNTIVGAAAQVQIGNAGNGSPNRLLYALPTPAVFEPTTYQALHTELAGMSVFDLANHYVNSGINEGRQGSPAFAPVDYRGANGDLWPFNNQALLRHVVEFGVDEGRQTSLVFNGNDYRFFHADLTGFGNRDVYTHYLRFGVNEGRQASIVFDPAFYRSSHGDLTGLGNRALLNHYLQSGVGEGRRASIVFDPAFYRSNHGDLAGLGNRELLHHYLRDGLNQGRRASAQFDPAAYRYFNPDLANHSNRQLVTHYLRYGRIEGRKATFP